MPRPLLYTEIVPSATLMSTFKVSIVGSLICTPSWKSHPHRVVKGGLYLVVSGIDENFVDYFEESWHIFHFAKYHTVSICVVRPHVLCDCLDAADVGIWTSENMVDLRKLKKGLSSYIASYKGSC